MFGKKGQGRWAIGHGTVNLVSAAVRDGASQERSSCCLDMECMLCESLNVGHASLCRLSGQQGKGGEKSGVPWGRVWCSA